MFIAPMHSYVTNVLVYNLHITIFSRVYSYVTRVYSYVTRMLLVCSFSHDPFLRLRRKLKNLEEAPLKKPRNLKTYLNVNEARF